MASGSSPTLSMIFLIALRNPDYKKAAIISAWTICNDRMNHRNSSEPNCKENPFN
jgi:hypothetical protein